eukprot:gene9137-16260_t
MMASQANGKYDGKPSQGRWMMASQPMAGMMARQANRRDDGMTSDGGIHRSALGGPASIVASAAAPSLAASATVKIGSNASVGGGEKHEAGKEQAQGQRMGRQKISPADIERVQMLIERCLQLYMTQKDVAGNLKQQHKIEPEFTNLVWQKLEEQNPDFFKAYYLRLQVKDQIVMFNYLLEQQVMMVQWLQMGWMENVSMMAQPSMPPMPALGAQPGMPGMNTLEMGMPSFPAPSGLNGLPMIPGMTGMGAGATCASGLPSSRMEGAVGTSQMPGGIGGVGTQAQSSAPVHRGSSSEIQLLGDAGEDLLDFGDGLDVLGDRSQAKRRMQQQQHIVLQQQHRSNSHFNLNSGDGMSSLPKNFSFSDFGGIPGSGGQTLSDFHLTDIEGDRLMMLPSSRADCCSPPEPMVAEGSTRLFPRLSIQPQETGGSAGSCSEDHAAVMMPAANTVGGDNDDRLGSDPMVGDVRHEDEDNSMPMLGGIDDPGDCLASGGIPRNFSFGDMAPIDFGALADHSSDQHQ